MKSNTTSRGIKPRAISTFIILFGLVVLIFFRFGLVPAIGLAVAIIVGRKVAKHIIAEGTDRPGRRRDDSSQTKHDATQQAGRGVRE